MDCTSSLFTKLYVTEGAVDVDVRGRIGRASTSGWVKLSIAETVISEAVSSVAAPILSYSGLLVTPLHSLSGTLPILQCKDVRLTSNVYEFVIQLLR